MEPFTEEELKQFEKLLSEQKQSLVELIRSRASNPDLGNGLEPTGEVAHIPTHPGNVGTQLFDQELGWELRGREGLRLREINEALQRIHTHVYGCCERCGELIPKKRLLAKPETRYDAECAEIVEKENKVKLQDHSPDIRRTPV